jgi:hypothetical protein
VGLKSVQLLADVEPVRDDRDLLRQALLVDGDARSAIRPTDRSTRPMRSPRKAPSRLPSASRLAASADAARSTMATSSAAVPSSASGSPAITSGKRSTVGRSIGPSST